MYGCVDVQVASSPGNIENVGVAWKQGYIQVLCPIGIGLVVEDKTC